MKLMRKMFHVKRVFPLIVLLLMMVGPKAKAQSYGISTNMLGWATLHFNLEGSMSLNNKWTLHLPIQYNPWTLSKAENTKWKNITVLPGARYWLGDSYSYGWFVGANAIVSRYNVGNMFGSKYRYDGWAYGLGFSAGYTIPISKWWNVEFEFGVGGVYYDHKKYDSERCGLCVGKKNGYYVVPNKLAVNFTYLF